MYCTVLYGTDLFPPLGDLTQNDVTRNEKQKKKNRYVTNVTKTVLHITLRVTKSVQLPKLLEKIQIFSFLDRRMACIVIKNWISPGV